MGKRRPAPAHFPQYLALHHQMLNTRQPKSYSVTDLLYDYPEAPYTTASRTQFRSKPMLSYHSHKGTLSDQGIANFLLHHGQYLKGSRLAIGRLYPHRIDIPTRIFYCVEYVVFRSIISNMIVIYSLFKVATSRPQRKLPLIYLICSANSKIIPSGPRT